MKVIENVTGNGAQAQPLIVGVSTVYVHENITPVTEPDESGNVPEDMYRYREIQYTKDEYIELISTEKDELADTVESILTDIIPSLIPE